MPRPTPLTILLPPSEGKAPDGDGHGWTPDRGAFGDALADRRTAVADALLAADGGDRRLLGVGGDHLERARSANRALVGAPTLPAWRRYTGVVWDHLEPSSLPAAARRSIVVVSGLHGLVRADDPIPDYRLKMSAAPAPLGTLSRWWRPVLVDTLATTTRCRTVVDLLPREHRAALDTPATARPAGGGGGDGPARRAAPVRRLVTVDLVERTGAPGGHAAKAAKGRLARHLLTCGLDLDDALASWVDDRFDLDVLRS